MPQNDHLMQCKLTLPIYTIFFETDPDTKMEANREPVAMKSEKQPRRSFDNLLPLSGEMSEVSEPAASNPPSVMISIAEEGAPPEFEDWTEEDREMYLEILERERRKLAETEGTEHDDIILQQSRANDRARAGTIESTLFAIGLILLMGGACGAFIYVIVLLCTAVDGAAYEAIATTASAVASATSSIKS